MHEPVDGRQRHGLFGEDRALFAERLVGGDEQGAVFVAGTDQFEQYAGLGLVLAHVGDVVEDEQVVLVELADRGLEHQFAPRDLEFLHQIGSVRVQDPEAIFDECQADRPPQVTLPDSGRADQDQVGALVQPAVARDQGIDTGGSHTHTGGVEVLGALSRQGLEHGALDIDAGTVVGVAPPDHFVEKGAVLVQGVEVGGAAQQQRICKAALGMPVGPSTAPFFGCCGSAPFRSARTAPRNVPWHPCIGRDQGFGTPPTGCRCDARAAPRRDSTGRFAAPRPRL